MTRVAFVLVTALAACSAPPRAADVALTPQSQAAEWPELVSLSPILAAADAIDRTPPSLPRSRAASLPSGDADAALLQARLARLRDRAEALNARSIE